MPFASRKKDHPNVPRCKDCKEEMIVTLRVPLPYAAGFEDVYYECPACKTEMKVTAIPV